jgi:hypothetical protein
MIGIELFPDALTAGRLCIEVIEELVPCRAIFLHMFDHRRNDYVLVDFSGSEGEMALLTRSDGKDPLLAVMLPLLSITAPGANTFVCEDDGEVDFQAANRFALIGGAKRVMLAPVRVGGRTYGVIELVDPMNGEPFEHLHERAVAVATTRYAEFLRTHGAVLDIDEIATHAWDR